VSTYLLDGHFTLSEVSVSRKRGSQVPRQELLDAVDGVIGNALQHGAKVEFWVETVQLGRTEQTIERCGPFPTGVGARKKIAFATQCHCAQRPFCR
jgi:hypothetical protein